MNPVLIHSRQMGIVDPDLVAAYHLNVIGVGAIGSNVARCASQLGFVKLRLYDPDYVEPQNIGTQFYRFDDKDADKVAACRTNLLHFLPHLNILPTTAEYTHQVLDGIVIVGVDSMKARSTIWESISSTYAEQVCLLVDGRTAGQEVHIYTIRPSFPEDAAFYHESIVPDEEAEELPCSMQGAPHTQFVIAGLMVSQIVRWLLKQEFFRFVHLDLISMHMSTGHPVQGAMSC